MQSGWRSSQLSSFTRKDPGYSLTEPSLSWKMVVLSPSICILLNQGPGSPKNTREVICSREMEWCRHSFDAAHICFYFVLLYVTDDYIQNAKAPKRSALIQFLLLSRWKRSETNWKQDQCWQIDHPCYWWGELRIIQIKLQFAFCISRRSGLTGTWSKVMSVTLLLGQLCHELLSLKPKALVCRPSSAVYFRNVQFCMLMGPS